MTRHDVVMRADVTTTTCYDEAVLLRTGVQARGGAEPCQPQRAGRPRPPQSGGESPEPFPPGFVLSALHISPPPGGPSPGQAEVREVEDEDGEDGEGQGAVDKVGRKKTSEWSE